MTVLFKKNWWLCSHEELRDELITHVKERGTFDVGSFFSVSDYLVRGKVTQYHHDYVTKLAQQMNLAGSMNQRDSVASRIVDYTLRNATLFSNASTPYVLLQLDGHSEVWSVRSKAFKDHITRAFYDIEGIVLNDTAINNAMSVIEGKAVHEGLRITLHNRVAWCDEDIYFDLSNDKWQVVRISKNGWEVIDNPPPLFKRYGHQKEAIFPQMDGNNRPTDVLDSIFELVNFDPNYKLLFLVMLVFSLVPDVPHPIPVVSGEQGSAKSSLFRIWKSLIDPSILQTMSFPRKTEDLIRNIDHHWFITFDNISKMSEWQSDSICRAVTGDGFSKRRLYTDDEDFIYSFKRMIGLNGINNVAEKPDLLERSVLFRLPAIPLSKRMDEEELWKKFDELAPSLMSMLFDVLSKAMQIRSSVSIDGSYRMADFTKWGCAIAQALGYSQSDFLDEYHRNLNQQNIEALEIDPVGVVIEHFWESYRAAGKTSIKLPPAQVYDEMVKIAESISITPSGKGWPKNPQVMARRLGHLRANLRQQGIEFTSEREDRTRYWVFSEVDPSEYCVKCVIPSETSNESEETPSNDDGIMTESEVTVNCVMEDGCLDAEECSHDAMTEMTEMTEYGDQSQSTQELSLEIIIALLAQKPWTEGELRDKVISLGFSRDSFDAIFSVVRLDPRVQYHGVTPIYYSTKAER